MTKAMKHKPRGFLRDFQVLGERHASDPFRMVRNHPNRHKPLAKRQFCIRENRADFDRKPVPAIATLESLAV